MSTSASALNTTTAVILGTVIGMERKWGQHPAGLRTNTLVALGAALFVGLSALIERESSPSRIAAQVVSGLGFLGGGVILREGVNVRGLNTAATLWCSGAIGTLAGAGRLLGATVGTVAVLFVHVALRPVAHWIDAHTRTATNVETCYRLLVECDHNSDAAVRHILLRHVSDHARLSLQGMSREEKDGQRTVVRVDIVSPE